MAHTPQSIKRFNLPSQIFSKWIAGRWPIVHNGFIGILPLP
ncbi:hypothetical protein CUTA107171_13095 [Cupriavidus taiwanensis]